MRREKIEQVRLKRRLELAQELVQRTGARQVRRVPKSPAK